MGKTIIQSLLLYCLQKKKTLYTLHILQSKNMQKPLQTFAKPKPKTPTSQVQKPKKHFPTISQQIDIDARQCIQRIVTKIQNSKMQTLHPPYFQKTLTKFREESFSVKLRPSVLQRLSSEVDTQLASGLKTLEEFITSFDQEYIDVYCEQIREPYIRKIFNQGYEIDKVNFKRLNSEYELRTQIQQVLNQTSEFLIQLEVIEDLLSRIELYFDIKCDRIMEKLKEEGAENRKGTWADYFASLMKKTTSYALRKGSRVVQNTGYASMLSPAFAMLTWAIIGGSSTLPWKGGLDIKSLLIPLVAFTVPFMLDSMAETIERSDFKAMLQGWAEQFQSINNNLRRFSQTLDNEIIYCARARTRQRYMIHYTTKDLSKYVHNLSKRVDEVSSFDEETFEQMRQRTKAYFIKYVEVEDGQWTAVMTVEQYEKYVKNDKNGEEKWEEKDKSEETSKDKEMKEF